MSTRTHIHLTTTDPAPNKGEQSTETGLPSVDPDAEPNDADAAHPPDGSASTDSPRQRRSLKALAPHRLAIIVALAIVLVLATLTGWLGLRAYEVQRTADQRALFLQVGRQAALNLTTIDWQHADDNVRRILDSATGTFHEDFSQRSQPFVDVVKQVQSKTEGTITLAGLESASDTAAQILVAVNVTTSTGGGPQQSPRAWRMRISVQKVEDDVKVANVEFVP